MATKVYCHFFHTQGNCTYGEWCDYVHGQQQNICPNGKSCPIKVCNISLKKMKQKYTHYQKNQKPFNKKKTKFIVDSASTCTTSSRNSIFSNKKQAIGRINNVSDQFCYQYQLYYSDDNTNQMLPSQIQENIQYYFSFYQNPRVSIKDRFLATNKNINGIVSFNIEAFTQVEQP